MQVGLVDVALPAATLAAPFACGETMGGMVEANHGAVHEPGGKVSRLLPPGGGVHHERAVAELENQRDGGVRDHPDIDWVIENAFQALTSYDPDRTAAVLTEDAEWLSPPGNAAAVALEAPNHMVGRKAIVHFFAEGFPVCSCVTSR